MTQLETSPSPGAPAPATGAPNDGHPSPGPEPVSRLAWFTLAISSTAAFMVAMEVTVISLALPEIKAAFPGTTPSTLSWVFSAYSIGVASLLLVGGWAADLYGRKRLFLTGMTLFALGSLLSGTAQSMAWLIGARALQSVGGAMLFPSGLALVLAIFPPSRRQLAIGIWAAMGGLAGAVGPSAGALLIEWLGWRAVFLFNVPVAAVAVPAGLVGLVESKAEGVLRRVDVIGVPLASLGVGALVLAIVEGSDWGWGSGRIVGLLVLSVLLVSGFVVRSLRHPAPLFDLGLLRIRSYAVGLVGSLLFAAGFFGSWVLLPTFIQAEWHWSVVRTGLAFMPASLISAVLSGPIGSRVDRFGHRRVVALGGLLAAAGMASFALFMQTTPRIVAAVAVPTILLGLGMAVLFAMIVGAAMRDVPMARYGSAGAGRTTIFQMGQALGVAVGVAVIGQPQGAQAALNAYRHNWIISASVLALVVVLFLAAYPHPHPRPAVAGTATSPPEPLVAEPGALEVSPPGLMSPDLDALAADDELSAGQPLSNEPAADQDPAPEVAHGNAVIPDPIAGSGPPASEPPDHAHLTAVPAPEAPAADEPPERSITNLASTGEPEPSMPRTPPADQAGTSDSSEPADPAQPAHKTDLVSTASTGSAPEDVATSSGGSNGASPAEPIPLGQLPPTSTRPAAPVMDGAEPSSARWRTVALVGMGGAAGVVAVGLLRRVLARRPGGA